MILELNDALEKVAPIDGVRIGRKDDRSTWDVYFRPEATKEERAAAKAVIESFDPTVIAESPLTVSGLVKILIDKGVLSADDLKRKG
jgi:hypothetical protein